MEYRIEGRLFRLFKKRGEKIEEQKKEKRTGIEKGYDERLEKIIKDESLSKDVRKVAKEMLDANPVKKRKNLR